MEVEVLNYFNKYILPLKDKFKNYRLVITGPIASGKSTLLSMLLKLFSDFKVETFKEFINTDKEIGHIMLSRFINNKISDCTFQNYIMDEYNNNNISDEYNICLFEKIPDDSIFCFSKFAYLNGNLTFNEYDSLVQKLAKTRCKFNLPVYSKIIVLTEDQTIKEKLLSILEQIYYDINHNIMERIFGLQISLEKEKEYIKKRNRNAEENYSDEYLLRIINYYNNLYEEKMDN